MGGWVRPAGTGGGGGSGGGSGGGPHTHDIDLTLASPYTDKETWLRAGTSVMADNDMYQTGIEIDTTKTFIHIGLVVEGDGNPRLLTAQPIRTADWLLLEVDTTTDGGAFENITLEKSAVLDFATDDRFNVISLHLRRYQSGGDDLLAVGVQLPSDAPATALRGIQYFYEEPVTSVEGTSGEGGEGSGSGSGSGGGASDHLVLGTLPDTLTADHVGRIYNIAGHLVIVRERHRDGTLTVTWTHYGLGSTPVNTNVGALWGLAADAYRFRGIAARGSQITGANDDDVYVNPGGGWFKYNNESGSATGWVHLRAPDDWQGIVDSEEDAESLVTDDAQVFGWGTQIHVSSDYERADAIASIQGEAYDPHADVYSLVQFWGPGQTESLPGPAADRDSLVQGSDLRYRFIGNEPDAVLVGHDPGIRAVDADDATDANLLTDETLPDYSVLNFPPGYIYRVRLIGQHKATTDVSLSGFMYEIMSGVDDIERQHALGYSTLRPDPLGTIGADDAATRTVMDLDFAKIFDFRDSGGQVTMILSGLTNADHADGNWYAEIERIG